MAKSSVTVGLHGLQPARMEDHCTVLALAKRRSGKSMLLTDLMHYWHTVKRTPKIIVMSGSEETNSHYSSYVPKSFIYKGFSEQVISKLMDHQRKKIAGDPKGDNRCLLILDDIGYDKKAMRSEGLKELMCNGRHLQITIFLTLQYVCDVTPDIRSQVDYVFTLKENIRANREKLYRYFYGIFPTFDMFNQVMSACTQNYECLVLDNTGCSTDVKDNVFYFKAKQRDPFKFGSASIWQYHAQHTQQQQNKTYSKTPPTTVKKEEYLSSMKKNATIVNVVKC